jgi:hypothetical protein
MKIGISLAGVSYDDGSVYRHRNYEDSINQFYKYIINPLSEQGHDVKIYIYTYDTLKTNDVLESYKPISKSQFINQNEQILITGTTVQGHNLINGLRDMVGEDLDLVIKSRFDIQFFKNPFEVYNWDFEKINFLWREPYREDLPLLNDTFFTFPYSMLESVIQGILDCELNPYDNCKVALHNLYRPLINLVGENNVIWLDNEFKTAQQNQLYKLTRHE